MKMPYFDTETATCHMDLITGDCALFHENGKYWTYKKFEQEDILPLIAEVQSSLKLASTDPKSEL